MDSELATLVSVAPPPFIFIHDPNSFYTTASTLKNLLDAVACSTDNTAHVRTVIANAISSFTPRLLYDHIINSLANWTVKWEEGCSNWSLTSDSVSSVRRWNDSFDSFIHGLRVLHHSIRTSQTQQARKRGDDKNKKKGKGKQKIIAEDIATDAEVAVRFVIVIEHAEHLQETMPALLVPLTRLSELTQLDLTVIFLSQTRWEDMKPPFGASPDPYFIDIPLPKKEQIVNQLQEQFDKISKTIDFSNFSRADTFTPQKANRKKNATLASRPEHTLPGPYHPSLRQLYSHFISILCDICYPFTHDPREIQYIAAARWPGFVQPVLSEHAQKIERLHARSKQTDGGYDSNGMDVDDDYDEDVDEDETEEFRPPTEDTRLRLSRLFKPTMTNALEELYPRLTNAVAWAQLNSAPPDPDFISLSRPSSPVKMAATLAIADTDTVQMPVTPRKNRVLRSSAQNTPHTPYTPRTPRITSYAHNYPGDTEDVTAMTGLSLLPRLSKFILIAAFIASTNPAKSDIRMFGRGLDEKKRRRRRTTSTTGSKTSGGPSKVPQRLLGPTPFPLDRLVAILGALLEENDINDEIRLSTDELFKVPGEYTDMEISRVGVYTTIGELSSIWLLHRTSPPDRLDSPPMYKCGISYDDALGLAKELDVPLNDLLWDPL